jgi:hypothetical protein
MVQVPFVLDLRVLEWGEVSDLLDTHNNERYQLSIASI